MKNNLKLITAITALSILMFSCRKEIFIESGAGLADWTTNSHSNNVDPNYDVVFNQSKVHRIDIVFTSSDWNDMQDDLDDVTGGSGGGPGGGGPGGGFSDQTPKYFAADFFYGII